MLTDKQKTTVLLLSVLILVSIFPFLSQKLAFAQSAAVDGDREDYQYLKEQLKKEPDNQEIYLDLSETCVKMGRVDEAEKYLRQLLQSGNKISRSVFCGACRGLGMIYANTDRLDDALQESRAIEHIYPYGSGRWDLDGRIYYGIEMYDTAEESYFGESDNPTCTDNFIGLGNIYRAKGEKKRAETTYKAGPVFDPDCSFSRAYLGTLLISQKKYDEAGRIFEKLIKFDPELGEYRIYRGDVSLGKKDYKKALDDYETALRIDPARSAELALPRIGKTYLLLARGEDHSGLLYALFTGIIVVIFFLGLNRMRMKSSDEEVKSVAVKYEKIFIAAIIILVLTWISLTFLTTPRKGEKGLKMTYYKKAAGALEKAVKLSPRRQDLRIDLASALEKTGKLRDAEKQREEAKNLPPYNPEKDLRFTYP